MNICALNGIFPNCTKDASSIEHIIPNAIGGRKKTDKCICASCNNSAGHAWDSVLCRQFESLSLLFGITRERGKVRPVIVKDEQTGDQSILQIDGRVQPRNPVIQEHNLDDVRVELSVSAPNSRQAIGILKSKIEKMRLEVDWENLKHRDMLLEESGLDVKFRYDLAGPKIGRAISKIIYLYSIDNGIERCHLEQVFRYLCGETQVQCFGPYYENDVVCARPESIPLHVVAVRSGVGSNALVGYVELFGLFRYAFILGEIDSDICIEFSYVFDPVAGVELENSVDIEFLKEYIHDLRSPQKESMDRLNDLISSKFSVFSKQWFLKNKNHVNDIVVSQIENKLGKITENNIDQALVILSGIFEENKR